MDTKDEFAGKYMNFDNTKDGDIATMLGGGELIEMKDPFTGKMKKVRNIPVRIGDVAMVFTPWPKEGRQIQEAFGYESDEWAGKKLTIMHIDKKMIIRPIVEEKV